MKRFIVLYLICLVSLMFLTCQSDSNSNLAQHDTAGNERDLKKADSPLKTLLGDGIDATLEEAYWHIGLIFDGQAPANNVYCGGSLINRQWILTACHCTLNKEIKYDKEDIKVFHGSASRKSGGQLYEIDSIIRHPHFDFSSLENDIALLRLKEPVLNQVYDPSKIQIPDQSLVENITEAKNKVMVVGWGEKGNEGPTPDTLQKITIPMVSLSDCKKQYESSDYEVKDSMICAGFKTGWKNTFHYDSGGSMTFQSGNTTNIVGIVSWSSKEKPGMFGVYTNVSLYRQWIEEKTNHSFSASNNASRPITD